MKISLIGYGKMGKIIEQIALDRGHEIVCRIDVDNKDDMAKPEYAKTDVAIEFTVPGAAVDNVKASFKAGVSVVCGSTAWHDRYDEVVTDCIEKDLAFFSASNFSIGVNIFYKVNKHLAAIMNNYADYDVAMEEIHHTQKLDDPSGTAITLAEGVIDNIERKKEWECNDFTDTEKFQITAKRLGTVPGTHTITYDSTVDEIEIMHRAKSRHGFALGAVIAAEFLNGKKGIYGMDDLLNF